jgi:hypothetical protein
MLFRDLGRAASVCVLLAGAGCGDGSFYVERAPSFPRAAGASVSVFGVYRDGRLAPEAWDSFRSHLAPLFGTAPCEPGYPDILTSSGTATLQAVDDFARANGVTDELLARLSTLAKGQDILLITMTGRPGSKGETESEPAPSQTAPMRGGGRGGMRGTPSGMGTKKPAAESNAFEAVGIVFSAKEHRSVAAIRFTYTGTSLDEALQAFMTKLGEELPGATCGGWVMDGHVEASEIRRLETE